MSIYVHLFCIFFYLSLKLIYGDLKLVNAYNILQTRMRSLECTYIYMYMYVRIRIIRTSPSKVNIFLIKRRFVETQMLTTNK